MVEVLRVVANGAEREVRAGASVQEFIQNQGLDPRFIIVERNGEPVERRAFADVVLSDGDRLELVKAVAGG